MTENEKTNCKLTRKTHGFNHWDIRVDPNLAASAVQNSHCWGIVDGFAVEMGSFSIKELEADKAPFGSPRIERDKYWAPKKASEVWSQLNERGNK